MRVNGCVPATRWRRELRSEYGLASGRYWYDPCSGLIGPEGGGAAGRIRTGLPLGWPKRTVSAGRSGVVVNGREVPAEELVGLLEGLVPGHYFVGPSGHPGRVTRSAGEMATDHLERCRLAPAVVARGAPRRPVCSSLARAVHRLENPLMARLPSD